MTSSRRSWNCLSRRRSRTFLRSRSSRRRLLIRRTGKDDDFFMRFEFCFFGDDSLFRCFLSLSGNLNVASSALVRLPVHSPTPSLDLITIFAQDPFTIVRVSHLLTSSHVALDLPFYWQEFEGPTPSPRQKMSQTTGNIFSPCLQFILFLIRQNSFTDKVFIFRFRVRWKIHVNQSNAFVHL